jgi:hypothetical protein
MLKAGASFGHAEGGRVVLTGSREAKGCAAVPLRSRRAGRSSPRLPIQAEKSGLAAQFGLKMPLRRAKAW